MEQEMTVKELIALMKAQEGEFLFQIRLGEVETDEEGEDCPEGITGRVST